jgi:hypothetical protein
MCRSYPGRLAASISATRNAFAAMVNDGLVPPLVGKKELSTT